MIWLYKPFPCKFRTSDPVYLLTLSFAQIADVNDKGEAIVKLVGVKINSDYLVTMRARNSVGMGPESTGIVNTGKCDVI